MAILLSFDFGKEDTTDPALDYIGGEYNRILTLSEPRSPRKELTFGTRRLRIFSRDLQ